MCKIFTLTNTSKIDKLNKAINTISNALSEHETDGFGYAIVGKKGQVFGERTIFPETFLTSFNKEVLNLPFASNYYNRFGEKTDAMGPGIFHGRTSTNDVNLINTHPISQKNWHLIHNGVVSNHGPEYKMESTNDTEHVLHYLMKKDGIRLIEQHLTGYYAVSAIDPQGNLHVIKDNVASLYVAKIKTIDSMVFATTPDLIETVCKKMEWEVSVISVVDDNCYLIFSGNVLKHHETIKPRGRTNHESKFANLSLGRDLEDEKTIWNTNIFDASSKANEKEIYPSPVGVKYTEDEQMFLAEVNQYADMTYIFKDYHGKPLSFEEFNMLDDDCKLYCTVIRSDGTVCSPEDYYTDKLYSGAV